MFTQVSRLIERELTRQQPEETWVAQNLALSLLYLQAGFIIQWTFIDDRPRQEILWVRLNAHSGWRALTCLCFEPEITL